MTPEKKKALMVYGLGIFVVLLCWSAVTAVRCVNAGGHWYGLYCAPGK